MVVSLLVMAVPTVFGGTVINVTDTGLIDADISIAYDDDALAIFNFTGLGSYTLVGVDSDDNPYGYGVDTTTTSVISDITSGGGFIQFEVQRLDSKTSMYGGAGQDSYSVIVTSDSASLDFRTKTNFAELQDCEYGFAYENLEASGTAYVIQHTLTDADGDGAIVIAGGDGSALIKLMGSKSGGKNSYFNMGCLPVCGDGEAWDDNYAKLEASGTGYFDVHAWADNGLTVHEGGWVIPGDGSDDSATYDLSIGYSGTFNYLDFGIKGD
jgi:hypothetical protein